MRVEINFTGDSHDAVISSEEVTRAVRKLFVQAEETAQAVKEIRISAAQTAESVAGLRRMAQAAEQVGQEARKSRREVEALSLAGRTGVGLGPFGSGFGRVGLLGTAIGLGTAVSGPAGGAAGALGLGALGVSGGAVASIGVLVASFHGLGKAIEGDRQEFEKLDPVAQRFVGTLRSLAPWAEKLQLISRQGLLPGITAGLHEGLTPETAGRVEQAVRGISGELGKLAEQAGKGLGGPQFQQFLSDISTHGVTQLDNLGDAAGHLASALLTLDHAAQPLTDWLTNAVDDGARLADEWARASEASGDLAGTMGSAQHELELVAKFLGALVDDAFQLGSALTPLGNEILSDLTASLQDMADWLDRNQKLVNDITVGALHAFEDALRTAGPLAVDLAKALEAIAKAMGGWESAFSFVIAGGVVLGIANITKAVYGLRTALLVANPELAALAATAGLLTLWAQSGGTTKFSEQVPGHPNEHVTYENGQWWLQKKNAGRGHASSRSGISITAAAGLLGTTAGALAGQIPQSTTTAPSGGQMQLPTTFNATHDTMGADWVGSSPGPDAVDLMAKPGTKVLAPEDGQLTRISGHSPSQAPPKGVGGPWGRSFYFIGASGTVYFGTHLSDVAPIGSYRKGEVIAIIGDYPGLKADHIHWSIVGSGKAAIAEANYASTQPSTLSRGSGGGGGGSAAAPVGTDPFSTSPSFTGGKGANLLPAGLRLAMAKAATTTGTGDDRSAIGAAVRWLRANVGGMDTEDQINGYLELASLLGQLKSIAKKATTGKATKATLIGARGQAAGLVGLLGTDPFAKATALPESLNDAEDHLAAVRRNLLPEIKAIQKELGHAGLTAQTVATLRAQMGQYKKTITSALDDVKKAIERQKDGFKDAWAKIGQAALDAFDDETAKHVSPSRALLKSITDAHDQQQLQDALTAANKQLADAMVGQLEDPQGIVQRARDYVGKTMLANAVDATQSTILGGAASPVSAGQMLADLQQLLVQQTVADPDAVAAAQKAVEDAKYAIQIDGLGRQADAEDAAYADERAAIRKHLEEITSDWERYFSYLKGNIAAIPGWWVATLNQLGLSTTATTIAGDTSAGGSPATQLQNLHQQALAGAISSAQYQYLLSGHKLEVPEFATGGIVRARPGGTLVRVGEGGEDEMITPMSRAGRGGPVTVVIQTRDEALADFIDVRVEGAQSQINRRQGVDADVRRRAGTY